MKNHAILFRNIKRKSSQARKNVNEGVNYHYHKWEPRSIEKFWTISTTSVINEQFYPIQYWEDLLDWAKSKISEPTKIQKLLMLVLELEI